MRRAVAAVLLVACGGGVAAQESSRWSPRDVASVRIGAVGLGDDRRDGSVEAEPCDGFRPRHAAVVGFFARARRHDGPRAVHDIDHSACHAAGRLRLRDGRSGEWSVNRLGFGVVRIDGRPVVVSCESCIDGLNAPAPGAPRLGHAACGHGEQVIFDCPSRESRISVCASDGWTPDAGRLEYRFGVPGRPALVVPGRPVPPRDAVVVGVTGFSGGGVDHAAFAAGGYTYTVYSAVGSGWGLKSGVAVERAGERVSVRRCDRGSEGEFARGFTTRPGLVQAEQRFQTPP